MNALTKVESAALALPEDELLDVLQSSLYPGATLPSIKMVLGYCKAGGLDPMQKPVHLVPMSVKKPGTRDQYEWRDIVMPGIGLYRTQAARTGEHVGTDEPQFGPMVEFKAGDFAMQVPEWCKVTVYRLKGGVRCAFTATEFWAENYATAGRDSQMPNAMWKKRSRGQLAKCAEAQALRKGFPEVGNQPTAEEMEGKFIDEDTGEISPTARKPVVATPVAKAASKPAADDVTDVHPKGESAPTEGPQTTDTVLASVGELAYITKKITTKGLTIAAAREAAGLDAAETLDGLTRDGFVAIKDALA